MLMILGPARGLASINARLQQGVAAGENVFQLIDEYSENDTGKINQIDNNGAISFINVNLEFFTFMILSRFTFFFGTFQDRLDVASERREAISMISSKSSVLTSNDLAPHLSRRRVIALTSSDKLTELENFDEVLLDKKYPG